MFIIWRIRRGIESKVWITKYALTRGIFETEVSSNCLGVDPSGNMIATFDGAHVTYYHGEGKEWYKNKESAVKRANEMRKKKIESLKNKIEQLENTKFD